MRSAWVVAVLICGLAYSATAVPLPSTSGQSTTADGARSSYAAEIARAETEMMAHPERALARVRAAETVAGGRDAKARDANLRLRGSWLQGEALARLGRLKEAAPIIAEALGVASRRRPNTKLHGDLLMSQAGIAAETGDASLALRDLILAHRIFRALGEERSQAIALLSIGSIYDAARDYPRALRYFEQSAEVFSDDPSLLLAMHNNRGSAFKELRQFDRAEGEYRLALIQARKLRSASMSATILTNLASAQYLGGRLVEADATALAGLREAARAPSQGLEALLSGVRAQIAFAQGQRTLAANLIERTFLGVDLKQTTLEFRDFHAAAEQIYTARGDTGRAIDHLRALKRLDDETAVVVTSSSSALLNAQFDVANQDLRISRLRSGQLERDVLLARERERLQRITLLSALAVAAAIIVAVSIAWLSARRSRNQVRAANTDLTVSNAALEKGLTARTAFLAATSHEIRTPLNGILGMTQVILCDDAVSGAQRERIAIVHDAAETMRALVDDILDVAKIETGTVTPERLDIELVPLLRGVGQLWLGQAEAKGVRLEIDLSACPERMIGDPRHLRQVIFNLMSNAVKFTDAGSVVLTASIGPGPGGEMLVLSVADTGIGISDDDSEMIFESFHQVDNSTGRRYGGTGLGLAICRALSRASGGDVSVVSRPGEGSVFTYTCPIERPLREMAAVPLDGSADTVCPPSLGDCDVLVAEANPMSQSFIKALMVGSVRALEIVSDVDEALAALAAKPWHHVVVGTVAPRTDLLAAVEKLASEAGHACLTILVAPEADVDERALLLGVGAFQVVTAPDQPFGMPGIIEAAHGEWLISHRSTATNQSRQAA